MKLIDKYNRRHSYLRLSLTDKCNLNCAYCNPLDEKSKYFSKADLLSFDEIQRLVEIFVKSFEFKKIRLTGGEPFARKDLESLIQRLSRLKIENPSELSATSNGVLINGKIKELLNLGIDRFNFSLDTLQKERFIKIAGSDNFDRTFASIEEAIKINPELVKINMVVMKGINDDEIEDFVKFAADNSVFVRFIEYMPFSNNAYDKNQFISFKEMLSIIAEKFELLSLDISEKSVSKNFQIKNSFGKIGFITSLSEHFCDECDRLRITADGKMKLCLFSCKNCDLDLKALVRSSANDTQIANTIQEFIGKKEQTHKSIDELINLKSSSMISVGG